MAVQLNEMQEELCAQTTWDFSDLSAVFVNCTLKRSPELSHTQGLVDISAEIMRRQGVTVTELRAVDHDIAGGVCADDMTRSTARRGRRGRPSSSRSWPPRSSCWRRRSGSARSRRCAPAWSSASTATRASSTTPASTPTTGGSGGCLVTGNEDGIKHCAMNVLYSLQHLGFVIPPQADVGWIGEAGPGPSYLDPGSGGPRTTSRTATRRS